MNEILFDVALIVVGVVAGSITGMKMKYPHLSWSECVNEVINMWGGWFRR